MGSRWMNLSLLCSQLLGQRLQLIIIALLPLFLPSFQPNCFYGTCCLEMLWERWLAVIFLFFKQHVVFFYIVVLFRKGNVNIVLLGFFLMSNPGEQKRIEEKAGCWRALVSSNCSSTVMMQPWSLQSNIKLGGGNIWFLIFLLPFCFLFRLGSCRKADNESLRLFKSSKASNPLLSCPFEESQMFKFCGFDPRK